MEYAYDSRNPYCKNPFGAARTGSVVTFSVYPEPGQGVGEVCLLYTVEATGETAYLPMARGEGLEGRDAFHCMLPVGEAVGPIWYNFQLKRGDGGLVGFLCPELSWLTGRAVLCAGDDRRFQLTVYDRDRKSPAWYGEGVTYHVFADRFRRCGEVPELPGRRVHRNWYDTPEFLPDEKGEIENRDFFGGSLRGIEEKLPYLESLGVETLFLSPIFRSASNHRYDTGDYLEVDPMLGDGEDFSRLCRRAEERGIRVILDGVFNHTGYDSRYFNARGTYDSLGAYQSKDSPYFGWYTFTEWPDRYSSWWGIYTLPQVNETNPDYLGFIVRDRDSVVRRWLRLGASGWRLDVADELPDSFILELQQAAREEKPDAVVIGEVWEDASNKISYDCRRKYLLGMGLDGVMNYPFKDAVVHFLTSGWAERFRDQMEQLRENYPREAFYSCMNGLGTHDTPRILTILGLADGFAPPSREERACYSLSSAQYRRAVALLKLGTLLQFAFPGSPCIYYGDEAGMEGLEDPFNRRGYPWGRENRELVSWYRVLGELRRRHPALRRGDISYPFAQGDLLCLSRALPEEHVLCAVNRGNQRSSLRVEWPGQSAWDALTGRPLPVQENRVLLELEPLAGILAVERLGED